MSDKPVANYDKSTLASIPRNPKYPNLLMRSPVKGGRPKGPSILSALRKICGKRMKDLFPDDYARNHKNPLYKTRVNQAIAKALAQAASQGNLKAIEMVLERVEGPVPLRVAGHDGGPLQSDNRVQIAAIMAQPAALEHALALADMMTPDGPAPELPQAEPADDSEDFMENSK